MEDLLGSNPTGSAPLYACARPVTQFSGSHREGASSGKLKRQFLNEVQNN
jgi:hypothetical protein